MAHRSWNSNKDAALDAWEGCSSTSVLRASQSQSCDLLLFFCNQLSGAFVSGAPVRLGCFVWYVLAGKTGVAVLHTAAN